MIARLLAFLRLFRRRPEPLEFHGEHYPIGCSWHAESPDGFLGRARRAEGA